MILPIAQHYIVFLYTLQSPSQIGLSELGQRVKKYHRHVQGMLYLCFLHQLPKGPCELLLSIGISHCHSSNIFFNLL